MTFAIVDARQPQYVVIATGGGIASIYLALAKGAATDAVNARDSALAATNFFDGGIEVGEAATTTGEAFAVEYPIGYISYRVRTPSGSVQIARALTTRSLEDELASARGKFWVKADEPTAAETQPGDSWIAPDGTFALRRSDTALFVNGKPLSTGQTRPAITWAAASSQPILQLKTALRAEGIDV